MLVERPSCKEQAWWLKQDIERSHHPLPQARNKTAHARSGMRLLISKATTPYLSNTATDWRPGFKMEAVLI